MLGCVSPPELTDLQLWAYLDGRSKPDVITHLEHCPYCHKRADQLATFQKRITTTLYRLTCPSSMELGEFHLGMLSGDRAKTVQNHLEECPHCSQEMEQLKNYLSEVGSDLEISFIEKVKVFVAQLAAPGENQGAQPGITSMSTAFAGLRGEQAAPLVYQVETFQISVEAQDDPEAAGFRILLGLATGIGPGTWQARLLYEGQPVKAVSIDNLGNFIIPDLKPGLYQLLLTDSQTEILIQDLTI